MRANGKPGEREVMVPVLGLRRSEEEEERGKGKEGEGGRRVELLQCFIYIV